MKIAVLDFGKTNSKLLVFDAQGNIVSSIRTQPMWHVVDGFVVLDEETLGNWVLAGLNEAATGHPNELLGVMVSAHGCTFALADQKGLIRPILDYEQWVPADLAPVIDAELPPYSETFTPPRAQGFNLARHMLWLSHVEPGSFERATAILGYPQFWSWRLGGRQVTETTYMGCHSYLWAPARCDYSSLVDKQGWRGKMPPLARAGAITGEMNVSGQRIAVHNGIHDSNAALHAYRSLGLESFTLISTGTWVVIFNADCPLDALDLAFDMYCNVDVDGRPVPTMGFMGGREFEMIAGAMQHRVDRAAVQRMINQSTFVLPAFAPAGPCGGRCGRVVPSTSDKTELAAAAMLYVALMTDLCLDQIRSTNAIMIDGGLVAGGVLAELIAQLRPNQAVSMGGIIEGTAAGAAALAFAAHGLQLEFPQPHLVSASAYKGLSDYRQEWRAQLAKVDGAEAEVRV